MNVRLSHARRGVLLLLVLGLLALFALVAVAFVIISGQSQRSSRIMQRVDQTLVDPQKQLNEAMMQVARGPSNFVSVIGPHSLLEDMYGNTSVYAHITSATPVIRSGASATDGQLIEITYELASPSVLYPTGTPPWIADPNPQYRRLGCLVMILDSNMMGASTRIVGINPSTGLLQLLATDKVTASNINSYIAATSQYPRILINGAPFSGTGFGFNPASGRMDLSFVLDLDPNTNPQYRQCLSTNPTNLPLSSTAAIFTSALLPNMPLLKYLYSPDSLISSTPGTIPGGANEDYDAADYQNMVLGAEITSATGNVTGVIPSLHRPALANYWFNQLATSSTYNSTFWQGMNLSTAQKWTALMHPYGTDNVWGTGDETWYDTMDPMAMKAALVAQAIVNFKRRIICRPLPEDNPGFDGGNPTSKLSYIDTTTGTTYLWERDSVSGLPVPAANTNFRWDVDNDGDGVADSIWIDLGFPVRAAKDGKLYKPLFAILCLDMDGRLNLNAHGDLAQAASGYYPAAVLRPILLLPIIILPITHLCRPIAGGVSVRRTSIFITLYLAEPARIRSATPPAVRVTDNSFPAFRHWESRGVTDRTGCRGPWARHISTNSGCLRLQPSI